MPVNIPKTKLTNGFQIPVIGLGTYARKADPGQFRQAVEWGIELGYRHIDTAACYKNEEEVGEGIANKIKEGSVKRGDLFVTTKLWNDRHSEKDVVPALKESLAKLKLDYVDLYLIHWPISVNAEGDDQAIDHLETWHGMEEAVNLGLTKFIGVSNFSAGQLRRLVENSQIKPVINQFEVSPTLTQHELVNVCKQLGVQPMAYTPLGLLSEARPEFNGLDAIKTDPKLGELAEKYRKTKAQICLKYLLQRGLVILPKSFTKSRIEENASLFDFELTQQEMALVDGYNINHRCVPGLPYKNLKNYPF